MAEAKAWVMIPKLRDSTDDEVNMVLDMRPLVLCKECRYSEHDPETNHLRCQHPFGLSGMPHGADWFCADGERDS